MRILLVEPQYRKGGASSEESLVLNGEESAPKRKMTKQDDALWYPPLGLMKLASFHKSRGDEVKFVSGCDKSVISPPGLLGTGQLWDRVYITTLFTFHWKNIIETIEFYKKAVGGTTNKIFVGGIMSTLMADEVYEETGVYPISGTLNSPSQIGLEGCENIDLISPDYEIIDPSRYAINDTYYGYTSRGCINSCPWCGVPRIEPEYIPYIDIKPMILSLRSKYGDKPRLRLMDNNVLASPALEKIVQDLLELGYGRSQFTASSPKKQRVVDFNQGLDATFVTDERMQLVSQLNIRPMRIAFDRASEKKQYVKALQLASCYGVKEFSNYMLYNWKDTPRDLYERLVVNIQLNEQWAKESSTDKPSVVYSYPMRFAPIDCTAGVHANRRRDLFLPAKSLGRNWLDDPVWTPRFVRNIEIMKGVAHGAISPTTTLAWRTIGSTFEEFLANLYMPEELLRNRNKHEKHVHKYEPKRAAGSGKVEQFRAFILDLLKKNDARFRQFHDAVCENSTAKIRHAEKECKDEEIKKWFQLYLKK